MRQETLLFVIDKPQGRILLAMKKVRFGAGYWNGFGGGVEPGAGGEPRLKTKYIKMQPTSPDALQKKVSP